MTFVWIILAIAGGYLAEPAFKAIFKRAERDENLNVPPSFFVKPKFKHKPKVNDDAKAVLKESERR